MPCHEKHDVIMNAESFVVMLTVILMVIFTAGITSLTMAKYSVSQIKTWYYIFEDQRRIYNFTNGTSIPGLPLKMRIRGLP